MIALVRAAAAVALLSLFSSSLFAQTMTISPGPILTGGTTAQVSYSDPSKAGQEIGVVVTGSDGTTVTVTMKLDGAGNGRASVAVSEKWRSVSFQAPGVETQTLFVE